MALEYSKYKDSGVDWIGEIPEGWEIVPIKSLFYTAKGLNITKANLTETGVPVLSYGQIHSKSNKGTGLDDKLFRFVPSSFLASNPECLVHEGCFLIADTSEDREGCGNAIYVDRELTLFAGYHTIIARPYKKGDYKYIAYQMQTDAWRQQIRSRVSGIKVYSVNQKHFNSCTVLLPPLSEQQSISNYLDALCGKIDALIGVEEETIAELQAYKQSIISETVTKGLQNNAKLIPSGVEWIGDVPEGWEVCKFGRIISVLTDYTANGSFGNLAKNVHYQSEGFARLVRLTDLRENLDNDNGVWVDKYAYEYLSKSSLYGDELLMANVGANSGFVCIMPVKSYPCTLAPNMFLIKQDKGIALTQFIYYLLTCRPYFEWLQIIAISSAQPKLNKDNIRNLPIILPPLPEQKAIAAYLDKKTAQIDALIAIKQQKIDALKEYRKSSIYEYVTGKKRA